MDSLAANALVDALMTLGANFCFFDNLSSRTLQNIKQWLNNAKFTFIKGEWALQTQTSTSNKT